MSNQDENQKNLQDLKKNLEEVKQNRDTVDAGIRDIEDDFESANKSFSEDSDIPQEIIESLVNFPKKLNKLKNDELTQNEKKWGSLIHKIEESEEDYEKLEIRRQAEEEKLKKTEQSRSGLKKNLILVEKTIRDAETNIQQKMTLNFICRIAKVVGGVVIVFGFAYPTFMEVGGYLIEILCIIIGVIMTPSDLLHPHT